MVMSSHKLFSSANPSYISNLRATIGSRRAALFAGYTPKNNPTLLDTASAAKTAHSVGSALAKAAATIAEKQEAAFTSSGAKR